MLHKQILQEEKYLRETFGEKYGKIAARCQDVTLDLQSEEELMNENMIETDISLIEKKEEEDR